MLNLIKSNRMEHLVKALCAILEQVPADPMAPEWIGIQSRGMKQWLTTVIASHFGICANVSFLFPRQIFEAILELLPGKDTDRPALSREIMCWAVAAKLASAGDWPAALSEAGGPAGYVKDDPDGRKTWQLSRTIARVFDDYQLYRPDLLKRWAAPGAWEKEDPAGGAAWQAWLWQHLTETGIPLLSGLDRILGQDRPESRDAGAAIPGRICLFGVSSLPPRFLEAFHALGRHREIFLFLLTPSDQFFYDLGSERQIQKKALNQVSEAVPEMADLETGSPLLRSLGRSGREFHGIIENFDYSEPLGELFEDPGQHQDRPEGQLKGRTPTMLAVLQSDILNLARRGQGKEFPPVPVAAEDRSVTLHACHSPMREAQVLKDLILDIMDRDPSTAPHDIIVMMPDIEAYAPFLETVFSQEPRLPFTVSDRRKRSESATIDAFVTLLALRGSRLERSRVLDLLRAPAIAGKFDIAGTELDRITGALSRARVFWGKDGAQRQAVSGIGFDDNTWAFGLDRLFMGTAMPAGEKALAGSVLPCDGFEGLEAEILGKLAHFTDTLFRGLDSLDRVRTAPEWGRCLRQIILSMMAPDDGQGDMAFLFTAIDELCREGEVAAEGMKLGFPVMEEALLAKLDQHISQGSFMAGCITFCNLMPMRSIPFKVVCLMGMDGQSFPRQAREPGFNLMARFPRAGDKQVREEDCYLFLESLLSARSRLVITYTGMSISDNTPIPCAGPVDVLKDTMAKSFVFPDGYRWIFFHALHPFSPVYFDPALPDLFSFSRSQRDIAAAQEAMRSGRQVSDGQSAPWLGSRRPGKEEASAGLPVDIASLIRFFRRPAETWARESVGLRFPRLVDAEQERESFQVSGLTQYTLGRSWLDAPRDPDLFARTRASGLLPLGRKGDLEFQRVRNMAAPVQDLAEQVFPGGEAHGLDIRLAVGGMTFTGRIPDVYENGRYMKTFGLLTPDRLLTQWIFHLFYCAVAPGAGETRLVGRDTRGGHPPLVLSFAAPDAADARVQIQTLGTLYVRGMDQGLAFACIPCFHLAEALAREKFDPGQAALDTAVKKARPFWTGGYATGGEAEDRYTARVFGSLDPFADAGRVRSSGVLDTALAVFRPMMEKMEKMA